MNKQALVEFVRTALLKQEGVADNQRVLHFKRVEQGVNYAFNAIVQQIPMNDSGKAMIENYYVKHFYDQTVKESNGYRYFGVSEALVAVGDGKGVWYVQPSKGQFKAGRNLAKMSRPQIAMYNNLPVGSVMNETVWRFGNLADTKQIILEDIGDPATQIRKVDYGIVRAFSSYDDDEEVFIPDTNVIVQMCAQWLMGVYNDQANNNK